MVKKITNKVEKYLAKNPTKFGKPLKGNLQGQWRYRFSDYRVVYEIKARQVSNLVVKVGHRREIMVDEMNQNIYVQLSEGFARRSKCFA